MRFQPIPTLVLMLGVVAAGCASDEKAASRQLSPQDFVATADAPPQAAASTNTAAPPVVVTSAPASTDAALADDIMNADVSAKGIASNGNDGGQTANANPPRNNAVNTSPLLETLVMDAMVGQVNGRPIYANKVLEPIEPQLAALGQDLSRGMFFDRAGELIKGRLEQIVYEQLILGEAERDLSAGERAALTNILRQQREQLLAQFMGARGVAERELNRTENLSIDQKLDEERQRILVERLLRQKVVMKINVTRKDIERYYRDHEDEFNTPPRRTVHMIRVNSKHDADYIETQLASGVSFVELAKDPRNRADSAKAGLIAENAAGESFLNPPVLNEVMLKLSEGEYSPRVDIGNSFAWLYLASYKPAQSVPLREVQLDIERRLRNQQFQRLTVEYRTELFKTGSFTPMGEMAESLVKVAASRYAVVN